MYSDTLKGIIKSNLISCVVHYVSTLPCHKQNTCQTTRHKYTFFTNLTCLIRPDHCQQLFLKFGQQSMVNSHYFTYYDESVSVSPAQHCNPSPHTLRHQRDSLGSASSAPGPASTWWSGEKGKLGNNWCRIIAAAKETNSYVRLDAWDSDRLTPLLEHVN